MCKISVLIPAYNAEKHLERSVSSYSNQSFKNIEIIIVDDGSCDNTGEIAERMAQSDSRIKVIHTENGGVARARNIGLEKASGEWVYFCDADDLAEDQMLEEFLHEVYKNPNVDIIQMGGYFRDFADRSIPNGKMPKTAQVLNPDEAMDSFITEGVINHLLWTKLFRASLCKKISFVEGCQADDTRYLWRVLKENTKPIPVIPKRFYHYIQNENSLMHKVSMRSLTDQWIARKELFDEFSGVGVILNGEKSFLKGVQRELEAPGSACC